MQPDMPPAPPAPPSTITPPPQSGKHFDLLIIPLVLLVVLLLGAVGFGVWAYGEAKDYRKNVDEKVAARLAEAVGRAEAAKEAEFIEREKQPLREYRGPAAFGSVIIRYPKTWSAFVTETAGRSPINGYFHPGIVPGIDSGAAFALRVEVVTEAYADALRRFESAARRGEVSITAISPVNVPNVTGARVDGQIERDRRGSVVLFPLRDKTLRLTAQSEQYLRDFNDIILANLHFTP